MVWRVVGADPAPPRLTPAARTRQAGVMEVDVAIIGAGGAGLSLLLALDRLADHHGVTPPTVALVDPVHRADNDRTWCFWDEGASAVDAAVHRAWTQVAVVDRHGQERRLPLGGLRYVMVRSADFYALAEAAAARSGAQRITAAVDTITQERAGRMTVCAGDHRVQARWVFDSRPAAPLRPGNTPWLQHFRGWTVRFTHAALDPTLPVLMDFSVPQPPHAVAFGYVLPSDDRRALIEYTQFSRSRLPPDDYDTALRSYLIERFGSGGEPEAAVIEQVEDGVIPMTDAVFARQVGPRSFRLGTAGGATRASTGYTFAAMQRQAEAVALLLLQGRTPVPPAPHLARHRWMDAVLLRALDQGHVGGADLFVRLFDRNPVDRVLRFLDGRTSPLEDLALMRTAPLVPMATASVGDLAARLQRRMAPDRPRLPDA